MKKKIIIAMAVIFGTAIILHQIGWLDISLYKSEFRRNQSIATGKSTGGKETFSYDLVLKNQDEILAQHVYNDGVTPPTSIECRLEEIIYSGNYRLPFYKLFKVKYKCDIVTVKSDSDINVNGTVEGDMDAKIIGLCTTRKVKDIIIKDIIKSVMDVLPNHL